MVAASNGATPSARPSWLNSHQKLGLTRPKSHERRLRLDPSAAKIATLMGRMMGKRHIGRVASTTCRIAYIPAPP